MFPNEEEPDYWDFMYFSFIIGMTGQVSDVSITSRRLRKLALFHGVLSFFFKYRNSPHEHQYYCRSYLRYFL